MTPNRRSPQPRESTDPPRVLVVEDEREILELVADTLSLEGYQVRTTEEAHGVLSLIRRMQPDLIVLDLRLHGMSGVQLLPLLASDAPGTPVLVTSGAHDLLEEYAEEFHRLGAMVLKKPFSLDKFLGAVQKAITSKQRPSRRGQGGAHRKTAGMGEASSAP